MQNFINVQHGGSTYRVAVPNIKGMYHYVFQDGHRVRVNGPNPNWSGHSLTTRPFAPNSRLKPEIAAKQSQSPSVIHSHIENRFDHNVVDGDKDADDDYGYKNATWHENESSMQDFHDNIKRQINDRDVKGMASLQQYASDKLSHFGFNSVHFDGDTPDEEGQVKRIDNISRHLGKMADTIGIDPKDVSFGGLLSLRIFADSVKVGGRTVDSYSGVYSQDKVEMHLSKRGATDTLVHEWGHFLDNVLGVMQSHPEIIKDKNVDAMKALGRDSVKYRGSDESQVFGTASKEPPKNKSQEILNQIMHTLTLPVDGEPYSERMKKLDDKSSIQYLSKGTEMFARAFQYWVSSKDEEFHSPQAEDALNPKEIEAVSPLFENLMREVRSSDSISKAVLFIRKSKSEEEKYDPLSHRGIISTAKIVHEHMREFSRSIGEDMPHWEQATPDQQRSTIEGIEAIIKNPDMTARDIHDNWVKEKEEAGWKYGKKKDPEKKTHPLLVPFARLDRNDRQKDREFLKATLQQIHKLS